MVLPVVQTDGSTRDTRSVAVGDERYPVKTGGAMSALYFAVRRGGETVYYESPEAYWTGLRGGRPTHGAFMRRRGVVAWKRRRARILRDPEGWIQDCQERASRAAAWTLPPPSQRSSSAPVYE